jgi:hypothetical protein
MKVRFQRRSGARFGRSVAAGFASLGSFAHPAAPVRQPHASPLDALRSDWSRIGCDMTNVIDREYARIQKTKKSGTG